MHRHLRPLTAALVALAALLPLMASAANDAKAVEKARAKLATPPQGFDWRIYRNLALPAPSGWNAREGETLELSPQAFAEGAAPEIDFSVQVQAKHMAATKTPATQGLLKALKPLIDRTHPKNMLVMEQVSSKPQLVFVVRYRITQLGVPPMIVHQQLVADDKADTLTIYTFKCPERDWKANWPAHASPMIEGAKVLPGLSAAP